MFHFCQTPTHPMQKFCRFSKGKLRKSVLFILYYPCLVRYNSFPWSRTIRPAPSGPIWSFTCSRTNRAAWSSSGTRAPHSSYPPAPHKLTRSCCFAFLLLSYLHPHDTVYFSHFFIEFRAFTWSTAEVNFYLEFVIFSHSPNSSLDVGWLCCSHPGGRRERESRPCSSASPQPPP